MHGGEQGDEMGECCQDDAGEEHEVSSIKKVSRISKVDVEHERQAECCADEKMKK